jgi:hypothetical protein
VGVFVGVAVVGVPVGLVGLKVGDGDGFDVVGNGVGLGVGGTLVGLKVGDGEGLGVFGAALLWRTRPLGNNVNSFSFMFQHTWVNDDFDNQNVSFPVYIPWSIFITFASSLASTNALKL